MNENQKRELGRGDLCSEQKAQALLSRRAFLGRAGQLIALGTIAHFSLLGVAKADTINGTPRPCYSGSEPWYIPDLCDAVNPDCVTQTYTPPEQ